MKELDTDLACRLMAAAGFDPGAYRCGSGDLSRALDGDSASFRHFFEFGFKESRSFDITLNVDAFVDFADYMKSVDRAEVADGLLQAAIRQSTDVSKIQTYLGLHKNLFDEDIRIIFVIGDSHTDVYRSSFHREDKLIVPVQLKCTAGSAAGLGNPNSVSGYGKVILGWLSQIFESNVFDGIPILFKFGQVDTEFVFTYKRAKGLQIQHSEQEYEKFVRQSVKRYVTFLKRAIPKHQRYRVDVSTIGPPILADEYIRDGGYFSSEIASREAFDEAQELHRRLSLLQYPDLQSRTKMHALFNSALINAVRPLGFGISDDFTPCVGPDGIALQCLWSHNGGRDHHLAIHKETFEPILADRACMMRVKPRRILGVLPLFR